MSGVKFCLLFVFQFTDLNQDLLNYKLQLCKEMLEIAKVLHPGYSRTRAFLLMELQETLMEQIKRNLKNKSTTEKKAQVISSQSNL